MIYAKQKQAIKFTNDQYLALMKVVYLGNWMANACRVDNMKKDYEAICDHIFSFAPKFGLAGFMDHETTDSGRYYPTRAFEEETDVHELHDEYDEETVWDELAQWLGERDFFELYSEAEIIAMSRDEHLTKRSECVAVYNKEFEEHGIERVRIAKKFIQKNN